MVFVCVVGATTGRWTGVDNLEGFCQAYCVFQKTMEFFTKFLLGKRKIRLKTFVKCLGIDCGENVFPGNLSVVFHLPL